MLAHAFLSTELLDCQTRIFSVVHKNNALKHVKQGTEKGILSKVHHCGYHKMAT